MRSIILDLTWRILTVAAVILGLATALASMYAPSPLAPLFHNRNMKAHGNSVLSFAVVLVIGTLTYVTIALIVYRAIKRALRPGVWQRARNLTISLYDATD